MTDASPVLLREDRDGVATLTLNRPAQFNALSEALLEGLGEALDALEQDEKTRIVVLAAAGRAFCAGHDLREMRATPQRPYYEALFARCGRLMQRLPRLRQPVIAQVHGIATAAGCQLVAACDLAIAAESARFATSGINLGLFCATPAVALTRNVPRKQAFELLFSGEFIDAERAAQLGLVNRVVPDAALQNEVQQLAGALAAKSATALRLGKEMFYRQLPLDLSAAYDYAGEVMAANMMAADASEGIDAFLEKRPARFQDR